MNSKDILKTYGLHKNEDLEALSFDNEEDWLKLRTKGIGGSDVGAIMGLNKYSSPLQVYKAKVEGFKKDLSGNINVRKGKDLESLIRTLYVMPYFDKEFRYNVKNMSYHSILNNKYPWLRANLDGVAINDKDPSDYTKNFVIEIKFVSTFSEDAWNQAEYCGVPPYYYAQVQEYMVVTGMRKAFICAMFESKWKVQYYEIPFNPTFVSKLLKMSKEFYDYNMAMKIPPRFTVGIDTEDIVKALKPEPEKEVSTFVDASLNELAVTYKSLGVQIKELTKEQDNIKSEIIDKYSKGSRLDSPLIKLSVSTYTTERFDSAKFKEDNPGLYKQYLKSSDTVKLTVK